MDTALEKNTIRLAVVGLGKMGLSHFALVNAHPDTDTVACDATGFLEGSPRYPEHVHKRYDEMLASEPLDAVVIATPSRLHAPMVRAALERGLHVFCEKPFCLDPDESEALAALRPRARAWSTRWATTTAMLAPSAR